MCTILAWCGEHPSWPLVIAASRDEYEGRAASAPQALHLDPLVIGGRDDVAGGTWLAISERGFVVALANRKGAGAHDSSKRSRGELTLEAGRADDVAAARRTVEAEDPRAYNPFILIAADADGGFVAHGGERGLEIVELARGAHAITNWDLDSRAQPKAARALAAANAASIARVPGPDALARDLQTLLADHAEGAHGLDGGLCAHRPAQAYGTRSSWIVMLGTALVEGELARPLLRAYYIEGHPCEGELCDVSHLLRGESQQRVKA